MSLFCSIITNSGQVFQLKLWGGADRLCSLVQSGITRQDGQVLAASHATRKPLHTKYTVDMFDMTLTQLIILVFLLNLKLNVLPYFHQLLPQGQNVGVSKCSNSQGLY